MKNKLLLTFALLFVGMLTYGQTITHKTVASAGGSYSGANFSASFTMGQTFNATLSASGQMATQGFQQPVFKYFQDNDHDGYGNRLVSLFDFVAPTGYVLDSTDCDDNNLSLHNINIVSSIQGPLTVNANASITLTDSTSNGIWSSSNTNIATVNSSGVVTGVGAGTDTIKYTVSNLCGTVVKTKIITVLSTCLPSYVPTNGLVGWWPFCGNANDESGNGNNGSAMNGAGLTSDRNGNLNNAFTFDGVDDYVKIISNNASINNFTISTWMYTNSNNGGPFVHLGRDNGSTGGSPSCDGISYGKGGTTLGNNGFNLIGSYSCIGSIQTGSNLSMSTWKHCVVIKSNGVLSFYVDGTLVSTVTAGNPIQPSNYIFFGSTSDGYSAMYNGKLDDIGIWNRVLTSNEISNLFLSGQPCPSVSNIHGPNSIAVGCSASLIDSTSNGIWSSSNPAVATINASGVVNALSTGSTTISYIANLVCGPDTAIYSVTIVPPSSHTITTSICQGASYAVGSSVYDSAGTYINHFTNYHGCDSIVTLNLSINQATSHVTYRNLCRRDSTLWNGSYYSKTIIDTVMLSNAYGCDSMDILNLNVYPLYYNVVTRYFCKGSSFVYNGQTISTVGTYYYHFTSATGCDSTVRLRALNYPASTSKVTVPLCTGSSVTYGGSTFTAPGVYLVRLTNYLGCDSAVTLTVAKRNKTYSKLTIYRCANDSVLYNGLFYKNNGNYTVNLTNRFGCDSVVTLTVLSRPVTYSIVTKYFCSNDSLLYAGTYYKQPGTYIVRLRNYRGCDSVVSLRALNYPNKVAYVSRGICQGASLTFGGQSYTQAGIYAIHSQSYQGCDSVTQLTVFKFPTSYSNVTIYRCQGQTIKYNGQTYTANGVHTVILTNKFGCDSVITLLVLTAPKTYATLTHSMCQGDSLRYRGNVYKVAGTYYVNLQNYRGCDSIVRLRILYNNSSSLTTVILCPGQTYLWNGTVYTFTMAGVYRSRFVNYRGCDSIAVLKVYKGSCKELGTPTATTVTTVTIATDEVAAEEMDNTTAIGMNPELNIFPNPNTGNFMLQNNCLSCKQMHVEVFTMEGKLMYVADADNTSGKININLSVSAGMYWVKLSNKEGTYNEVKSFVVE